MPSALVQVADAVTAAIAGHDFGIQFECERSYPNWDLKLEDADCLRVDVVPAELVRSDIDDHKSAVYDCAIDIGVRKRFDQNDQEPLTGRIEKTEVDRLIYLVEQIHDYFCDDGKRELADNMNWRSTVVRAAYIREHLKDWRQFTGIIRITYEIHRPL